MFRNKHLIIAMLVTPILAVIAYFATGMMVGEKPHEAKPGALYKLVASPNCRFESGRCTLKNGELVVDIRGMQQTSGDWLFTLESNQALRTAGLAIVPPNSPEAAPISMYFEKPEADSEYLSKWAVDVKSYDKENDVMRVALSLNESFYYVETSAVFPEFITQFSE